MGTKVTRRCVPTFGLRPRILKLDLGMLSTSGYVAEQKYVKGQIPSEAMVRVHRKLVGVSVLVLAITAIVVVGGQNQEKRCIVNKKLTCILSPPVAATSLYG